MNFGLESIVRLIIVLFSAIVHEVSHGLMAEKFGDKTARYEGRITMNPLVHIDPFGSILLPLVLLLAGSPVILGAAKPVPVNFNALYPQRLGMVMVSLAGPLSNLVIAVLCMIPIRLGLVNNFSGYILGQAVIINLVLAIFNALPIPPLDGSKVVLAFAPYRLMEFIFRIEPFGFLIIFALLYAGLLDAVFTPFITLFFRLFGLSL
jgi:Zn-dependent protease